VALIVPYYQGNLYSTDIGPGWNTPTDAALASAIDYAHSVGLAVVIKMHNESYSGDWRAYISPSDRNTWFNNFNAELVHVATLAQAHHAEMFVMGTEMASVASSNLNSDNTQRWVTLIGNVRKVFTGKLTYDANSTTTATIRTRMKRSLSVFGTCSTMRAFRYTTGSTPMTTR